MNKKSDFWNPISNLIGYLHYVLRKDKKKFLLPQSNCIYNDVTSLWKLICEWMNECSMNNKNFLKKTFFCWTNTEYTHHHFILCLSVVISKCVYYSHITCRFVYIHTHTQKKKPISRNPTQTNKQTDTAGIYEWQETEIEFEMVRQTHIHTE